MKHVSTKLYSIVLVLAALLVAVPASAQLVSTPYQPGPAAAESRVAGKFVASQYWGFQSRVINGGNSATGSQTITVQGAYAATGDGRTFIPFQNGTPVLIDVNNQETVTPTAVSCFTGAPANSLTCNITASFSFVHGNGALAQSGTYGLQEAINDAALSGGGVVVVDSQWAALGGTNAMLSAAVPYPSVSIEDIRTNSPQYWNVGQATASFLAAPTTLTSTTVGFALNGANATAGSYTGTSTYHVCIAYVDIGGQEGPCSSDFSGLTAGTGSTNQIGIAAPAASTGAVGYVAYISLASGSYALAYEVPLTGVNCTLTKVESVTPACAVANTTYSQSGSNMIVSALTVNTAPLATLAGGANNQYTGNSNGRTTYAYQPSTRLAAAGIPFMALAFTATPGTVSSTNPVVMGTVNLPAGFMNFVGKTIRVCGKYKGTPSGTTTIENIQVYWDAAGSDSAGTPVQIGNIQGTATFTNVVYNGSFCEDFTTTVSGSGATAGSIIGGPNVSQVGIASAPTNLVTELDTLNSATASLNLANTATAGYATHLHVVQNHTTGSDGAFTLISLTVEVL